MEPEFDVDAIEWFVKEGGDVSNDTILKLVVEVKKYRIWYTNMCKSGCGYRECGMADSGFSDYSN